MAGQDPKLWQAPTWAEDFGNAKNELELLRRFDIALLDKRPALHVELDCFEEGYMAVNVRAGRLGKFAEIQLVSSDDFMFGVFFENGGEEFHFNKIEVGLSVFDNCKFVDT